MALTNRRPDEWPDQSGALDADALLFGEADPSAMLSTNVGTFTVGALATLIIALIVDVSPAALDTLNELAAALGDDPNFATTITNLIATKAAASEPFVTTGATAGLSGETAIGSIILAPDVIANRPAANTVPAGAIYLSTDTKVLARSTGAAWVVMVDLNGTYATLAGTSNLIDAAGDSLTGSADNTLAKLAKGTALQYRRMNSGANGEEWGDLPEAVEDVMGALSAGGTGLTMTYNDGSNTWVLDVDTEVYAVAQTLNAQTDSYTLVLGDAGKLVTLDKASGVTLTIPANASVAFPVGTRIDLAQLGAGQVTIAITSDTVNATPGLKLRAQYSGATLVKLTSTTWIAFGDLSA